VGFRHAIAQDSKDGVIAAVPVQPKANRTECAGIEGDAVKIRVVVAGSTDAGAPERGERGMSGIRVGAIVGAMFFTACSAAHPVLYPNAHLQSVGKEAAEQDIEVCKQAAESAGAASGGGKAGRVATNTAVGAGVGAASGAVGGAILGAAGRGSMIGAASGAVWGLLTGLFSAASGPSRPNQAYTNFVNRCLQEKGYEVTGWQ
jgi:hypothetical protein